MNTVPMLFRGLAAICCLGCCLPSTGRAQDKPAEAAVPSAIHFANRADPEVSIRLTIVTAAGAGTLLAETPPETLADLEELSKAGGLLRYSRVGLNTVENTPATLQAGEMVAIPTGRMTGFPDNRGGLSRQMIVERQSVGTLYSATARRTSSGKILVELKIEQTKLSPPTPSASDADEMPRTPGTQQLTFSTTVLLKSGEPEVLASWQTLSSEGPVQEVILLQAAVQE
ncbi:MAG: hypothetical protein KF777_22285 [Planctomycetaceae bacterium]|nr:hypothetical protein [Planctomycetaceae bacterium]